MPSIYIVIPAYNEIKSIAKVIEALKVKNYHNIIVVDDGSSDGTRALLQLQPVVYAEHVINRGQGAALRTGTQLAYDLGADYIVHFDADGQMSVDDIFLMLDNFQNTDPAVVLGSRFLAKSKTINMPVRRKLLLKLAKIFNKVFLGVNYSDPQNGFRVLNRQAVEKLNWENDRMAHCSEILRLIKKNKLNYKEQAVNITYSEYSLGKGQGAKDAVKIVWDLFINKF